MTKLACAVDMFQRQQIETSYDQNVPEQSEPTIERTSNEKQCNLDERFSIELYLWGIGSLRGGTAAAGKCKVYSPGFEKRSSVQLVEHQALRSRNIYPYETFTVQNHSVHAVKQSF